MCLRGVGYIVQVEFDSPMVAVLHITRTSFLWTICVAPIEPFT